ncbi:putative oxidoreductase [Arabidopsis thaliana]|uniref:NAD(P)-binding Rossmann-fold superfamily protein n=1 Tax=Arabidopsis thaliana TaxID=3702 RepID=F4K732_ARATH|nr:NAD(P)-binding Rossmann-fold superfamily protein [Arabidopsis thaliana]AED93788.1 NAD(P)-binding Rossmann-fold superfamily protein [Arabidopsis thaliana]|eukprot:NP_198183.1 NAD(P)-binding Rossmann-fold superfamily protein [Arabidopsis thaliana]
MEEKINGEKNRIKRVYRETRKEQRFERQMQQNRGQTGVDNQDLKSNIVVVEVSPSPTLAQASLKMSQILPSVYLSTFSVASLLPVVLVLLDYFVNQSASTSGYDDPDLNQYQSKKRIGIVGLGSIGSKVATRLKAFGCQISYSSRNRKPYAVPYHYYMDIEEMHGVIVNVALGAIIDEEEMSNVPKELFELDNVVFSPHCAFMTLEGLEELGKVVVGNIEAFFSNKPLLTPVL